MGHIRLPAKPGILAGLYLWLCLAVLIVGAASSVAFWQVLRNSETTHANRRTQLALKAIRADLIEDTHQRQYSVRRMAEMWELDAPPPVAERNYLAKLVIAENQGFQEVEFVDPSFHVTEVIRLDNDQSDLGRNIAVDLAMRKLVETATAQRKVTASNGYYSQGHLYRRVVVPVYNHDKLRGAVLINVDVRRSLADMLSNLLEFGYSMAVIEDGKVILDTDPEGKTLASVWTSHIDLDLPGVKWTIYAAPGPEVVSTFRSRLPEVALGVGLLITVLLVLLLSLMRLIARHDEQLLASNAELRKAFELQQSGEAALRESEARFSGILEMSSDAVIATDEQQQIILFNKGAEEVFGYSTHEMIGKSLNGLIPARFHERHGEYIKDYGESNSRPRPMSSARPIVGLRKGEVEFPMEASISKLVLNGKTIYTAILRDATERYRAEEALLQMHAQLEARVLERTAEIELANTALQEEISVRTRTEEMLSQLSGRLLQLQDEERRRVARELHDSTAQYLAALALNISTVKSGATNLSEDLRQILADALDVVDRCSSEIRTMSYLLHPPLLDELGLVPALEWYAAGFAKRSGVVVHLEMPPKNTRIPQDVERTLFRIVQECLTNVRRHSKASEAWIKLAVATDEVRLKVSDNGTGILGFTQETSDVMALLGVGIAGMRERVRQLGGRLEITSSGEGTLVTTVLAARQSTSVGASN